QALLEIKQLEPWKYDGTGSFKAWVKKNLRYEVARANHYIKIATFVDLDLVAGKPASFDALLALCGVPAADHPRLVGWLGEGMGAKALRRLLRGQGGTSQPDPVASIERLVRQLSRCKEQGTQVPAGLLAQIQALIADLGGAQTDPRGSAASPETP